METEAKNYLEEKFSAITFKITIDKSMKNMTKWIHMQNCLRSIFKIRFITFYFGAAVREL